MAAERNTVCVAAVGEAKKKTVQLHGDVDSYHGNQVPVYPQLFSEHVRSSGKHTDKVYVIVLERGGHNSHNIHYNCARYRFTYSCDQAYICDSMI